MWFTKCSKFALAKRQMFHKSSNQETIFIVKNTTMYRLHTLAPGVWNSQMDANKATFFVDKLVLYEVVSQIIQLKVYDPFHLCFHFFLESIAWTFLLQNKWLEVIFLFVNILFEFQLKLLRQTLRDDLLEQSFASRPTALASTHNTNNHHSIFIHRVQCSVN